MLGTVGQWAAVASYGGAAVLAVLFVAFVLEGALVGKLLPTRLLLVGVVVALGEAVDALLAVLVVAVLGATLGQLALFRLVREYDGGVEVPAYVPAGGGSLARTRPWFDRWGLPAVAVSNALPVGRGSLTVPAALSDTPGRRFLACSLAGTLVYVSALVAVAVGVDAAIGTGGLLAVVAIP